MFAQSKTSQSTLHSAMRFAPLPLKASALRFAPLPLKASALRFAPLLLKASALRFAPLTLKASALRFAPLPLKASACAPLEGPHSTICSTQVWLDNSGLLANIYGEFVFNTASLVGSFLAA
jgi:hypothetical protein